MGVPDFQSAVEGFESMHGELVWHAAAIAHCRALQYGGDVDGWGFKGYADHLYKEAASIKEILLGICEWCSGEVELRTLFIACSKFATMHLL